MKFTRPLTYLICFVIFLNLNACSKQHEEKYITTSDAQKELINILENDYNIKSAVVRSTPNTTWIYIPFEFSHYDMNANDSGISTKKDVTVKQEIRLLEVTHEEKDFTITYDIEQARAYVKMQGYAYKATPELTRIQQNVQSAVRRAYPLQGNTEIEGNLTLNDEARVIPMTDDFPDFMIIVYADIKKGLETRNIFHLDDLQRASYDQGFTEEFSRRSVQIPLQGNPDIVGDKDGSKHLTFSDMTWPKFLALQIDYRIRFKYGVSAFAPGTDPKGEMLEQASTTLNAYDYDDYTNVILNDLKSQKNHTIPKATLLKDYPNTPESKGRLIEINFNAAKP